MIVQLQKRSQSFGFSTEKHSKKFNLTCSKCDSNRKECADGQMSSLDMLQICMAILLVISSLVFISSIDFDHKIENNSFKTLSSEGNIN